MEIEDVLALALEAVREERPIEHVLDALVRRSARASVVRDAIDVCSGRFGLSADEASRAQRLLERCLLSGALQP